MILAAILLLWLAYTAIYSLFLVEPLGSLLGILPGALGVAILLRAGFRREDCFLRLGRLSRRGLGFLVAATLIMPMVWVTGRWIGFDWKAALVFAPLSAFGQELFFRAALLPVLLRVLKGRLWPALLIHSALFAIWHIPNVAREAPLAGVIGVVVVTFVVGCLWGLQAQRDRTVAWTMLHHTLLLAIQSLFTWV